MSNTGDETSKTFTVMKNETSMVAIDVSELEKSMKRSLQTLGRKPKNKEPCTIYKVLHSVRREYEQDYDPKIIAIGPFHHKNEVLKTMEPLKWRYLRQLMQRSRHMNTLQNYINVIDAAKTEARSYYSEPVELDDNVFVEMMVLDGCFLIEFLVKAYIGENEKCLNEVNWNLPLLRSDLLLLENQIPFPILQLLFDASDIPDLDGLHEDGTPVTLMNLAVSYVTRNKFEILPKEAETDTLHHLLHAQHASLHPTPHSSQKNFGQATVKTVKRLKSLVTAPFLLLLSCFLTCQIPLKCCGCFRRHPKEKRCRTPRGIPTATQLQDCGIEFKVREDKISFMDTVFIKEDGIMEIPMLSIQEATISNFRNLIAFEQCCPTSGTHFTSHAVLMNSLISTAADVAILKDTGIIESKLGQDEEVAELFNKLYKGAYLDYEKHYHHQLFRDVVAYCNVAHHKWRAELMSSYFGNPWSTISLVAASFLVCLTIVQTFYTIYAYHHPPS